MQIFVKYGYRSGLYFSFFALLSAAFDALLHYFPDPQSRYKHIAIADVFLRTFLIYLFTLLPVETQWRWRRSVGPHIKQKNASDKIPIISRNLQIRTPRDNKQEVDYRRAQRLWTTFRFLRSTTTTYSLLYGLQEACLMRSFWFCKLGKKSGAIVVEWSCLKETNPTVRCFFED